MRSLKILLTATAALSLLAACETPSADSSSVGGNGTNGGIFDNGVDMGNIAPGSQADLAAKAGDKIYFATDSSVVNGEAQSTLERQVQWLNQYGDVNITVEGHADERGTREYNLALGERRANSTKNYLVGLGLSPARISTISYGKERPAVVGHTPSAWAQNRRAVTIVIK